MEDEIPQTEAGPEKEGQQKKKEDERSKPFISFHRPTAPWGLSFIS
jgi:hypothetical protein